VLSFSFVPQPYEAETVGTLIISISWPDLSIRFAAFSNNW
jgi:hypothetical protein